MIFAPGTTIGGRYELKTALAQGGMGSVWVARHLQLESDVAIKFMDPGMLASPILRARFEREARAAAQLQSVNIVRVHDFGFEGDTPFLVMELLRGESLEDRLQRVGRLPIQALASMLVQVSRGLRKAHEAGYVHRDLKPGNIFITSGEEEEVVKLLDFGIAKQMNATVDGGTQSTELVGSPHYMSPEQLQDPRTIDARSDLWSLGVILYRALTGELPFPGETVGVVMKHVLILAIPKASRAARGLPPGVDDFFDRAFAREKEKRFSNVGELTDAFLKLAKMPRPSSPGLLDASTAASARSGSHFGATSASAPTSPPPSGLVDQMPPPASPSDQALTTLETVRRRALHGPWLIVTVVGGLALFGLLLVIALRSPGGATGSPSHLGTGKAGDPAESASGEASDARSPVPKGRARLNVTSRAGTCKVTINVTNYGPTPVTALVPPGLSRVYCLTADGSTRRLEATAVEGQTSSVVFDL